MTSAGINEKFVFDHASKVKRSDISIVLENADHAKAVLMKHKYLDSYVDVSSDLFSLLKEYHDKEYKDISWESVAVITFAFLYLLNQNDVIPDVIPVVGFFDDSEVFRISLEIVDQDFEKYRKQRKN
jgi:uncharacterized membrane protein YkvA (DUF1232 family)